LLDLKVVIPDHGPHRCFNKEEHACRKWFLTFSLQRFPYVIVLCFKLPDFEEVANANVFLGQFIDQTFHVVEQTSATPRPAGRSAARFVVRCGPFGFIHGFEMVFQMNCILQFFVPLISQSFTNKEM